MGAIASKKASALASSRRAIAPASASEVSGPVATMPGDSSPVTSPRTTAIAGWLVTRSCTAWENATRSTASAAPPGPRAGSALARDPLGLGLLLLHPDEPAARAGDRDRAVPGRVVALRVAQAPEEVSSLPGAALREVAHSALRAFHAQRHGPRVLARGELGAGEELAVAPRLDHHRRAALLADLVGGPVGHLVAPQRPREAALVGVAGARDERAEPPAPHHQAAAARRAFLLGQAREVVHVVDQLLHVHGTARLRTPDPGVAQHLLPREIAFFHLVELVLHLRREPHLEHVGEGALHHLPHRLR